MTTPKREFCPDSRPYTRDHAKPHAQPRLTLLGHVPRKAVGKGWGNARCILQRPCADFFFFIFEGYSAPKRHILVAHGIAGIEEERIVCFARGNVKNAPAVESKRLRDFGAFRVELLWYAAHD
jgi:hypothetical protein